MINTQVRTKTNTVTVVALVIGGLAVAAGIGYSMIKYNSGPTKVAPPNLKVVSGGYNPGYASGYAPGYVPGYFKK